MIDKVNEAKEANLAESIIESFFHGLSAEELMRFDGLAEAEKLTGRSYKIDKETEALGMALVMKAGEEKRKKLADAGDTSSSTTAEEFKKILALEGFEKIYEKEFSEEDTWSYREDGNDKMLYTPYTNTSNIYVYWHPELFILLNWTTYPRYERQGDDIVKTGESINSGNMRYTIKLKDDVDENDVRYVLSTCSWERSGAVVGSHDIRDGFRSKLNALKKYYNFIKWEGRQFLWLLHYMQHRDKNYDHNEINAEVIKEFPDHVKEVIGNKYSGAPVDLQTICEYMTNAYFDYDTSISMTEDEKTAWFNETIDPSVDFKWFEETLLPNADNKRAFREWFRRYQAFNAGRVVTY